MLCLYYIFQGGHGSEPIKACNEVLEMDPENLHALCDRAEAHIANENYDDGMIYYLT